MVGNRKVILSLISVSLLSMAALSGCERKTDQTVPAAANSAAPAAGADSVNPAGMDHSDAMANEQEMERHHQQAMDHDAMRQGGMNSSAPKTEPAHADSAMPMKDM